MVTTKQKQPLKAIHRILILAWTMAYQNESPAIIAKVLDCAEILPTLISANEDGTEEFRTHLQGFASEFSQGVGILQEFDQDKETRLDLLSHCVPVRIEISVQESRASDRGCPCRKFAIGVAVGLRRASMSHRGICSLRARTEISSRSRHVLSTMKRLRNLMKNSEFIFKPASRVQTHSTNSKRQHYEDSFQKHSGDYRR